MKTTVCLSASTLNYPKGSGHLWVYLNWALGFLSIGCKVIWLEKIEMGIPEKDLLVYINELKLKLSAFGINHLALWHEDPSTNSINIKGCISVEEAAMQSDILLNQVYGMPGSIVNKFKKKILLDIDPGLLQVWMAKNQIHVADHDFYFTIGETVGKPGSLIPYSGVNWNYIPPCVSLVHWKPTKPKPVDPGFTTISHWSMDEWEEQDGTIYNNDKRTGFIPYFNLPSLTKVPVELAILFGSDIKEKGQLEQLGWRVKHSHEVTGTLNDYKSYIQGSLGEFSCVKPSCVVLQNAWLSDRSLCYLASGKPVIVQHTGKSKILPDDAGMFRFRNILEAKKYLEIAVADYDKHCRLARELVEEHFDSKKITAELLSKVL
jgi:hypothetical protein